MRPAPVPFTPTAPVEKLTPGFNAALALLLEACESAQELGHDVWDFALEIQSLRDVGLSNSNLRWLLCKGYVQNATEVVGPEAGQRAYQDASTLAFNDRTCFVLTEAGLGLARPIGRPALRIIEPSPAGTAASSLSLVEGVPPRWDAARRELRLADQLVKQFKLPVPNQETILAVFEEEGWPPRIDDPLPNDPLQDPKQRLHDTIKSLNRHQINRLIFFRGDGSGSGVRWDFCR